MQNNSKILLIIALILAVVSFYIIKNKQNTTDIAEQSFIPALKNDINDIDVIEISKGSENISLIRQNGVWHIKQVNNYLADANKIAETLLSLRKFEIKDKKTSNPKNYNKLGLADTGDNAATKILLKSKGETLARVAIGKAALHGLGIYVRDLNNPQSFLANGSLRIDMNKDNWIVSNILDIKPSQIKSVAFKPNKETESAFKIIKDSAQDKDFKLENIPKGKQLKATDTANNLAGGLQKLTINSVTSKDSINDENLINSINYELFTGESYQLNLYQKDEKYYLTLKVNNVDNNALAKKFENWLFVLPKYKFDALNQNLENIIQDIPVKDEKQKKNQKTKPKKS